MFFLFFVFFGPRQFRVPVFNVFHAMYDVITSSMAHDKQQYHYTSFMMHKSVPLIIIVMLQ